MPAFVNRRLGESGSSEDDGTMVCCFSRKKSRNDCRTAADFISGMSNDELMTKINKRRRRPAIHHSSLLRVSDFGFRISSFLTDIPIPHCYKSIGIHLVHVPLASTRFTERRCLIEKRASFFSIEPFN